MKSLFEKEETAEAIKKLKIDLISRFYPFTNDEVIKYEDILNFDRNILMENKHINWDSDLLDKLKERVEWYFISKLEGLNIDYKFYKRFEKFIDYRSLTYCKNVVWCDQLKSSYSGDFSEVNYAIVRTPFFSPENLEKHKSTIDWGYISRLADFSSNEEIIDDFSEHLDWGKLSMNKSIPVSVEFLNKHKNKLDFSALSSNPASLPLIYQYPQSDKWEWRNVIRNPGIKYNHASFDFFLNGYQKYCYNARAIISRDQLLTSFLNRLFNNYTSLDLSFFKNDRFYNFIRWENVVWDMPKKLSLTAIEKLKERINFEDSGFVNTHKDIITQEFLFENFDRFNIKDRSIYKLPITIDALDKYSIGLDMMGLSYSERLDWSWEFIERNISAFNLYVLAQNSSVYERLIPQSGVLSFLNDVKNNG